MIKPLALHKEIRDIRTQVSAEIARLRRTGGPYGNSKAHAYDAVFDGLGAVLSVLLMLSLDEMDEDEILATLIEEQIVTEPVKEQ